MSQEGEVGGVVYQVETQIEGEETVEAEVTIDGDNIDPMTGQTNDEGAVSFAVPGGEYKAVNVDTDGYKLDSERTPDAVVEDGEQTIEPLFLIPGDESS